MTKGTTSKKVLIVVTAIAIVLLSCFFVLPSAKITAYADGDNGNLVVYITKTGYAYHVDGCYHLRSKIKKTLKEAYILGKTPCQDCHPPEFNGTLTEEEEAIRQRNIEGNSGSRSSSSSSHSSSPNSGSGSSSGSNSSSNNSSGSSYQSSTNKYNNTPSKGFPFGIVGGIGALIFGFAGFSIADNRRQEAKEAELRIARLKFKEDLNGKRIRDKAGVPSNILFYEGYPKDNNNRKYGSFTYYVSKSGNRYHQKNGCCSARYPIHSFKAISRYSPCSKCCETIPVVPQWYRTYESLVNQAKRLGIDKNDPIFNTDRIEQQSGAIKEAKWTSSTQTFKTDSKTQINYPSRQTALIKNSGSPKKTDTLTCPRCGCRLVLRTARRGSRAGSQFLGCSNFPYCKYTRNL